MPHPIYGPPRHQLSRVEFTLHLPLRSNDFTSGVTIHGYSSTKRAPLWTVQETHSVTGRDHGLEVVDMIHHVALVAFQDHPASQEVFERAQRGGVDLGEQQILF